MRTKIHDHHTVLGYISAPEVESVLYWAGRVADNLEKAIRYRIIREKLLELIWDSFQVHTKDRHAISRQGIRKISNWAATYIPRLSTKQQVDAKALARAIEQLNELLQPNCEREASEEPLGTTRRAVA